MNEIEMKIESCKSQKGYGKINISVTNQQKNDLLYKFMIGRKSLWTTLKDYSEDKTCVFIPSEAGEYNIMVKAKNRNSKKSFDYVSRMNYEVKNEGKVYEEREGIITYAGIDKESYVIGEKIRLKVYTKDSGMLYRYWINSKDGWSLIKDYTTEDELIYTVKSEKENAILVECKYKESPDKFDDFKAVEFKVNPLSKMEIVEVKNLGSKDILAGQVINFRVEVKGGEPENILYKFCRINANGTVECMREYSTNSIFSYMEKDAGEYKLLCMVKDIYSVNEYDDRAVLNYSVKAYKDVRILSLISDMSSPQLLGREIEFKIIACGGLDLRYRFVVKGTKEEDTGFIRNNSFVWKAQDRGEYEIIGMVKDSSYRGDYEALKSIKYSITDEQYVPIKIKSVMADKTRTCKIGDAVNVMVSTEGGQMPVYEFKVFNGEEEVYTAEYSSNNWMKFQPKTKGSYKIRIRVKDLGSYKEFDCESSLFLDVQEFIPGKLDYILLDYKEYYRVGDKVSLDVITENTEETYIKYRLDLNGRIIEETRYTKDKQYAFIPKVSGKYEVYIYARNEKSREEYDAAKSVKIAVHDTLPVTGMKITPMSSHIYVNEGAGFSVQCRGGKDVVFEFYLMEKGEWKRVQNYSKKNFYSFMPFTSGKYKILAFAKSFGQKTSYEDYDIYEFTAEERCHDENII